MTGRTRALVTSLSLVLVFAGSCAPASEFSQPDSTPSPANTVALEGPLDRAQEGDLVATPTISGIPDAPLPDDAPSYVARPSDLDRRLLLATFVETDPRECWKQLFADPARRIEERGLAKASFAAPFIPTIPGSDRYVDELW